MARPCMSTVTEGGRGRTAQLLQASTPRSVSLLSEMLYRKNASVLLVAVAGALTTVWAGAMPSRIQEAVTGAA